MPKPKSAFAASISAHASLASGKSIPGTSIASRIISALKLPPPVDPKMKLSKVPAGGVVTNWDLALILMTYPPFARDGLELQKATVMNMTILDQLGMAVRAWYKTNGWTIS